MNNFIKILFLLFINFSVNHICFGQIKTSYIPEGGFISMFGNIDFGYGFENQKIIYTNRSSNPGFVNFVNEGNWKNAGEMAYVDGYVKVLHDKPFTFPIGDLGIYRPISISGGHGTYAAFFFDDFRNDIIFQNSVNQRASGLSNDSFIIDNMGYWKIGGNEEVEISIQISETFLANRKLEEIKMVGWNGSSWELIESEAKSIDNQTTNLTSVSIVPDNYKLIALAFENRLNTTPITNIESHFRNDEIIDFTIFPNPVVDINDLKIDYKLENVASSKELIVRNSLGELIFRKELTENNGITNIQDLTQQISSQTIYIGIMTSNGTEKYKPVIILK